MIRNTKTHSDRREDDDDVFSANCACFSECDCCCVCFLLLGGVSDLQIFCGPLAWVPKDLIGGLDLAFLDSLTILSVFLGRAL